MVVQVRAPSTLATCPHCKKELAEIKTDASVSIKCRRGMWVREVHQPHSYTCPNCHEEFSLANLINLKIPVHLRLM